MFKLIVKKTIYVNAYDSNGNLLGDDSGEYPIEPGEYTINSLENDINGVYDIELAGLLDPKVKGICMAPVYIEEDNESVNDYVTIEWRKEC